MLSASTCKEKNVKGYLNKPLYKQKFYLDVKNRAVASKLEAKIKELGGDIELFLVKDIKGLITDKDDLGVTNNKLFIPKTPQPGSNQSFFNSPIGNENDKARPKTRADAMLAKARVQSSVSTKDPLEEAKSWGISILSVEKAFVWLDKVELSVKLSLEKKKLKAIELKTPYLKFEAFDRKTRPVFQEIPNWPSFNLNGAKGEPAFICRSLREHTMTRKTRAQNAKTINLLQPGYCEACRVEYAYLEEHLKSDEHQNFINDSGNFKELDDLINDGCNISSFLKVNGASLGKYPDRNKCASPIKTTVSLKKMPRTRTSIVCDKQKPLISPTGNDSRHNLRTRRKNSVYNSISSGCEEEVVIKPVRELRSSTRLSAMTPKGNSMEDSDTWSSGRPKRSCIKQKRVSADERLVFDNKTYYRVEVLSNKLRSSAVPLRGPEAPKIQPNSEEGQEDKGLIVKFRKMRYSELARLNDEAENFLFPRRDESSSEEDVDDDAPHSTQSPRKDESSVLLSSESDTKISRIKNEEEHSMDSSCSEHSVGRKKKRRTQAEAFIADNQKYYKFEMPGSRLRYQGSYLSPIGAKNNGECLVNDRGSKSEQKEEFKEAKVDLNDIQFSFETVPKSEPWYQTFQRQDNGEEYYYCNFSDSGYWKPFILPYEIGPLPPVDPRICIMAYRQSQKQAEESTTLKENHFIPPESTSQGGGSTAASPVKPEPAQVENISKETFVQSDREIKVEHTTEIKNNNFRKPGRRRKGILLPSRNPRKSPRQHASTLAILSSLIHQRKRREGKNSRSPDNSSSITTLSSIPEERKITKTLNEIELEQDYESIAKSIDEVLSASLEETPVNVNLLREENYNEEVKLKHEMGALDLLEDYANHIQKQNQQKIVEIDNWPAKVSPGRRCGRKKKKNRTGWPNKNRRVYLKKEDKEDNDLSEQESMIDSPGVNQDSEDAEDDETNGLNNHKTAVNSNCKFDEQCMINSNSSSSGANVNNNEQQNGDKQGTITTMTMTNGPLSEPKRLDAKCREQRKSSSDFCAELVVVSVGEKITDGGGVNVDLDKWESAEKVLNARLSNSDTITADKQLQPIVRVEKLEGGATTTLKRERQSSLSPRRTNKRPRRMPASPKSPRILRKPRGRWYRERF
ncbi:protein chiffon isoform X2 [Agrilus planipennis]|uniref:Protein chiffon isoform X2 n=1 Tax=Agrilus planipennis TaxID=224129 RepID=A0A1W4X0D6_AGRPL|nr:protein chiffon isoform X2 [Agrilus planipennis]